MIRFRGAAAMLTALTMLLSVAGCSGQEPSGSQATVESTVAVTQPTEAPQEVKLDKIISGMTLEEKVGQLFYVRCPDEGATQWITDYHLGGFVLFGRDFAEKTVEQVRHDIQSYQQASIKVPLLIGVDEEGGDVVRISDNPNLYSEAFPSPKNVYEQGGWELLSLGVNVNMAPVCDISDDPYSFIYSRSFSGDVSEVNTFVTKTVNICKEKRLGTVLKHFPGYGDNADTHEDMVYDDRSYETYQKTDFQPFKAGVEAGADSVLVAHIVVESMDDSLPASLSPKVHEVLRTELDFDGVIMTDDLAMEGVAKYTDADTAAVAAIQCGNDLLCCSDVETEYPAVLEAVQSGVITEERVDESVRRILRWKQNLGLL